MKYDDFIKEICSLEGKKVQVSIGNIKEVWKCIKIIFKRDPIGVIRLLLK